MSVDELAARLAAAKKIEDDAKLARLQAELALLDAVEAPHEGARTTRTDSWLIETKGVLSRSVNPDALNEVMSSCGDDMKAVISRAVVLKPQLRLREYRELGDEFPEARQALDAAVVTKRNKTSVSVKPI